MKALVDAGYKRSHATVLKKVLRGPLVKEAEELGIDWALRLKTGKHRIVLPYKYTAGEEVMIGYKEQMVLKAPP